MAFGPTGTAQFAKHHPNNQVKQNIRKTKELKNINSFFKNKTPTMSKNVSRKLKTLTNKYNRIMSNNKSKKRTKLAKNQNNIQSKLNKFKLPIAGNSDFSRRTLERAELTNRKLNLERQIQSLNLQKKNNDNQIKIIQNKVSKSLPITEAEQAKLNAIESKENVIINELKNLLNLSFNSFYDSGTEIIMQKLLNGNIIITYFTGNKPIKNIVKRIRVLDLLNDMSFLDNDNVSEFAITIYYRLDSYTNALQKITSLVSSPLQIISLLSRLYDNMEDGCDANGFGCFNPGDISQLFLLLNSYLLTKQFKPRNQPQLSEEICQIYYVKDSSISVQQSGIPDINLPFRSQRRQ